VLLNKLYVRSSYYSKNRCKFHQKLAGVFASSIWVMGNLNKKEPTAGVSVGNKVEDEI
jgi:hypothetical protein